MIEVRVRLSEFVGQMTYAKWSAWVTEKLREAGVPLTPFAGDLTAGTLQRFDDPKDFNVTVYRWFPPDAPADGRNAE